MAGEMRGDVVARVEEELPGTPLLVPFVHCGALVREDTLEQMRERPRGELLALPSSLQRVDDEGREYPVTYSESCRAALAALYTGASSGAMP